MPAPTKESLGSTAVQCKVAILGVGTVGRSVAQILTLSAPPSLQLTHLFNRNMARKKLDVFEGVRCTEDFDDILRSDAEVVVELLGGLKPAEDWVRQALEAGKSVVTANKALIAHCGPELTKIARQHGQHLLYGASVAGGIPVLLGLQEGLGGDRIHRISGIVNGTCNYILTQIENEHLSFSAALEQAQAHGFAEAHASEDIEGYDARSKLTILSRAVLNWDVKPEQILARGIRDVEEIDFVYANDLGCTIRQISRSEIRDGCLYAAVQPSLVPKTSPLARVTGSQNIIVSEGEFGGETVFSGYGAGGNPTAVAVVSDLLWYVRNRKKYMHQCPEVAGSSISADFKTAHYLRFLIDDRPGILASLANVFSRMEINVDAVLQRPGYRKSELPFVITLEPCRAHKLQEALAEIRNFDFMVAPPVDMPILS